MTKIVLGPTEIIFNGKVSPIVENTLEIVRVHQININELEMWKNTQIEKLKREYETKYAKIVDETEEAIKKGIK